MRQIRFLAVSAYLILMSVSLSAGDIKVKMPSVLKVEKKNLILNGTGVRNKFCFDLYVGGLYLESKKCNASEIVNADETMAIKIEVISDLITSKRLEEGIRSEISRVTGGNITPYKDRTETIVKAFRENVKIGDIFDLVYVPGKGLSIYKNGNLKSTVEGLDFKQVIFSTWLGSDPADLKMKNGMIGV
jgi:hypothetical protein